MAIDTEAKRRSAIATGVLGLLMLPLADGAVGTTDRPHVCGIYAGITIDAPAVSTGFTLFDGVDGADQMVYVDLGRGLSSIWDNQQRVAVLGIRPSGEDVALRFLASRVTLYVTVHIQHDGPGGGGEAYDANVYVSDTRVDCTANRQQDTTIVRSTAFDYYVWLVPEFLESDSSFTRFDGEAGEGVDRMAFVTLGANSQEVRAIKVEMENLNEKLERLLTQAEAVTNLVLEPGEK